MIIPTSFLALSDLLRHLREAKSSIPNINVAVEEVARMMKEVQRMVQEMRELGCSNQTRRLPGSKRRLTNVRSGLFGLD